MIEKKERNKEVEKRAKVLAKKLALKKSAQLKKKRRKKLQRKKDTFSRPKAPLISGKKLLASIYLDEIEGEFNRKIDYFHLRSAYRGRGLAIRHSKNGKVIFFFISKNGKEENIDEKGSNRHPLCRNGEVLFSKPHLSISHRFSIKGYVKKFRFVAIGRDCLLFQRK
jgi:hypothetical protein